MTHFDCFLVGSWMFAIGWILGSVYTQNHNEQTERPRVSEMPETVPQCEGWRFPAVASASAD